MKLEQTFSPARPLAQHCAELTARGPRPEERAEYIAAWRRDVEREVAQDMAELLSGTKLTAQLSDAELVQGEAVFEKIGPVAANCLLRCSAGDETVLLSFDIATAIALTDRSFGGTGETSGEAVASLPRSASLMVEQAARTVAKSVARVSAGGGAVGAVEGDVIVRSESASRLKPFGSATPCALFTLTLTTADAVAWSAMLAMPVEGLDSLLPGLGALSHDTAEGANGGDPSRAVLSAIPMRLEAVLAEFDLSLDELQRLAPGDQIPLSVAREIPLRLDSKLIAQGRLGTIEERMALRLTSGPFVPDQPEFSPSQGAPA